MIYEKQLAAAQEIAKTYSEELGKEEGKSGKPVYIYFGGRVGAYYEVTESPNRQPGQTEVEEYRNGFLFWSKFANVEKDKKAPKEKSLRDEITETISRRREAERVAVAITSVIVDYIEDARASDWAKGKNANLYEALVDALLKFKG